MMMGACTSDDCVGEKQPKGLMPVLFSAGNMEAVITRSASASYMPEDSRFVCSMFFHAGKDDTNDIPFYPADGAPTPEVNMTTAWLKINNALNLLITTGGTVLIYYLAVKSNVSTSSYFAFSFSSCSLT